MDFETAINAARRKLQSARADISAEIANYPTPISGCDAQFNYLLEERQKVIEALRVLNERVFVPTPRTPTENAGVESR